LVLEQRGVKDIKDATTEEIATILGSDFSIEVSNTGSVPHAGDPGITFPNLDDGYQRCKLIETAVLYIDLRRSTQLNLEHKPETVAKLYSAFVRAMTRCAQHFGGHVRGIIGDRVMVLFNPSTAFVDAVNTAILMNSVVKYVLDEHFPRGDVECGIGIDYGRMLATKTGVRRHGVEQNNYRSLVWLGRPANVASKLTDLANKTTSWSRRTVREGYYFPLTKKWHWTNREVDDFLDSLEAAGAQSLRHKDDYFFTFIKDAISGTRTTPPILMTAPVYQGFRKAKPDADSIKGGWWTERKGLSVPGYTGKVYGGDVIFTAFRP
jgi:adenylate cyclase